MADILLAQAGLTDNLRILEPSAGEGTIIDRMLDTYTLENLHIDCVELNKEKADVLAGKGYNTHRKDFLDYRSNLPYDRIIAAPPFKGNIDLAHIKHMYFMLARKGILVSLTTPYWLTNNEPHQVEFREWLQGKEYYLRMLPDNSFIEKSRTVPTAYIKIFRK